MESDEGQADAPSNNEAGEVTKQVGQADEFNNSEAAGVVEAPDQDLSGNMSELNPGAVEDVREENLLIGMNEDKAGELTEPGEELENHVELKSGAEKEELGAPAQDETNILLSTDERETREESSAEKEELGAPAQDETNILLSTDQRETREESSAEKEELGAPAQDEINILLSTDQRETREEREEESEKEVAESVKYDEEVGELSGSGYGKDLEKIQEKKSDEEVPDADERELGEEALEGVAEDQEKDNGLVGIRQIEMHVLTEDEVGKLALGHSEDEVLVEFNEDMVVGKEGVESELDSKKRSEVYLRKVESRSTVGDATVVSQETEGFAEASQRETMEVPGKDVAPFVDQEKALEDHEGLREPERLVSAVSQRDVEDLVGITQREVKQVTRHEVAPAMDQEQGLPEDLVNTQEVASKGDAAVAEETLLLASASETQVIPTLDQIGASKTRGTEDEDTYKDAVLSTDERESEKEIGEEIDQQHVEEKLVGESEDVAGASVGMLEEIVASIVDAALALAEEEAVESVGLGEMVTENMDMVLTEVHGEVKEVTPERGVTSAADQEPASDTVTLHERVVEAQEDISRRGLEEIPMQGQDEEVKEEMKLRVVQEKVGELIGPEEEVSKDQEVVDQGEGKLLDSAGMFAEDQQDAGQGKIPFPQKSLGWSGRLDAKLARPGLRLAEEWSRPESRVDLSRLIEPSTVGSQDQHCRVKGKRIRGLAGLRQGPILMVPRGGTQSAGGISGMMKHAAPGLIVTSLTIEAERKKLMKKDHKQLSQEILRRRETRSAEPALHGASVKRGKEMVLMGYRIGREGMSCFSEADNRIKVFQPGPELETVTFQQIGETGEMRKKSDQGQTESPRQEQEAKEQKPLGSQVAGFEEQRLEELQLAWLGRPLSRGYAPSRPTSGWTAELGPGHGLTLGSLRAEIKERIDMMVVGQSAGQSPEPLSLGMGKRVFGLAGTSANVHWLQEVLGPSRRVPPLSVAGHSRASHNGSPDLKAERQSPGLVSGKQRLKDWRDGVMGIAIKKYNAMRRAMWGEGPAGLHVKGVNVAGRLDRIPGSSFNAGSILEQVERRVRRLAQHVAVENMPELEVDGQMITDRFKQHMQLTSRRSS